MQVRDGLFSCVPGLHDKIEGNLLTFNKLTGRVPRAILPFIATTDSFCPYQMSTQKGGWVNHIRTRINGVEEKLLP